MAFSALLSFSEQFSQHHACSGSYHTEHYHEDICRSCPPVESCCKQNAQKNNENTYCEDYPAEDLSVHEEKHCDTGDHREHYHTIRKVE